MRFCVLLLILFHPNLWAQSDSSSINNHALTITYLPSKLLIHKPNIHFQPNAFPQSFELCYKKQTNGEKLWQQKYGYPEIGLNLAYTNYNFNSFGQAIAFYPSIQFRLWKIHQSYVFFKLGAGLGLADTKWERSSSSDSFRYFIGTTLNNFTMFQIGYLKPISKRWTIHTGVDFFHLSNAATRKPNYGINSMGFFVGTSFHPSGHQVNFLKQTTPKDQSRLRLGVASFIAFAEDASVIDGPLFPIYSQSIAVTKRYRHKSRLWLSANAILKTRTLAWLKNKSEANAWQKSWQFSACLQNEFLFGNVGFPIGLGYYFNDPTGNLNLYQRLGMNYYFASRSKIFLKNSYTSLVLHTHLSKAQYAELGIGFLF
jgi:hypothetical protein